MLGNLIIAMSVSAFMLALLDILLSDGQKQTLSRYVLIAWNHLDNLMTLRFLDWLKRYSAQQSIAIVSALLALIVVLTLGGLDFALVLEDGERSPPHGLAYLYIGLAALAVLVAAVGPRVIDFVLRRATHMSVLARSIGVVATSVIAPALALLVYDLATGGDKFRNLVVGPGSKPNSEVILVIDAYWTTGLGLMSAILMMNVFLIALIIVPLLFILLARGLLAIVEFTIRRIAEYPKGPILASSALIGAVVTVIKAMH
jgi:hypothetical protein